MVLMIVETRMTKLFAPKIMICNVSKEESKDDIVDYLIAKNSYVQSVEGVHDKIRLVFTKPAHGNTTHYILVLRFRSLHSAHPFFRSG